MKNKVLVILILGKEFILKIKIILIVIGVTFIGVGIFMASTTKLTPPVEVESVEKEATGSAQVKEKDPPKKEEKKVESFKPVKEYQPTPTSKVTAEKVAQIKGTIKEPVEKKSPPTLSGTSDLPFSDEHLQGYEDNKNEYQDILNQMNAIYLQSLTLYQEYLDVPETMGQRVRGSFITQSQLDQLIEKEENRILHELNVLELESLGLEYRLDQLNHELCSVYFDILKSLGHGNFCS